MQDFVISFMLAAPVAYLAASFFESFFHDQILDISRARARLYFKYRRILPGFWNIHVAHGVLHHYKTFRTSYTKQFDKPEQRGDLLKSLSKGYDPETVRDFEKSSFGNTFTEKGYPFYALPVYVLPLGGAFIFPAEQAIAIALAFLIFATPFFILSRWVHPYMHRRYQEAIQAAPLWIRFVISSRYGLAIRISHWVHHKDPKYNLNLQYGADLLRGRFRAPRSDEYDQMVAEGVITPAQRLAFEGQRFLLHPF